MKPKPSWMPGLNSTLMIAMNEKPFDPSGIFVVMTPIAVTRQEIEDAELERAGVLAAVRRR